MICMCIDISYMDGLKSLKIDGSCSLTLLSNYRKPNRQGHGNEVLCTGKLWTLPVPFLLATYIISASTSLKRKCKGYAIDMCWAFFETLCGVVEH